MSSKLALGVLLLSVTLLYLVKDTFPWNPKVVSTPQNLPSKSLAFTTEDLAQYKYKYVAILGEVFDVSSKPETYGEGGSYSFFTGVDGTRAYATGTKLCVVPYIRKI
jgi:hypothetical protein